MAHKLISSGQLAVLDHWLLKMKTMLKERSWNAKLWFQYLDDVAMIKDFITAEWTGDWEGNLTAVSELLNLFTMTGHSNYAK